jgi:hypothetical protein
MTHFSHLEAGEVYTWGEGMPVRSSSQGFLIVSQEIMDSWVMELQLHNTVHH